MSNVASLTSSVQYLKGVGPERVELLANMGIRNVADVLFCFPRRYQDLTNVCPISQLVEDQPVSVRGVVSELSFRLLRPGRSVFSVLVQGADQAAMRAVWFNQPSIRHRFQHGKEVLLSGKPRLRGLTWEMAHPRVQDIVSDEGEPAGEILPVYPLTQGLPQAAMRRIVRHAVAEYGQSVEEALPDELQAQFDVPPIHTALEQIHRPASHEQLEAARRRFVFQELLVLQLALAMRRHQLKHERTAVPIPVTARIDARVRRLLPFIMTPDQEQAIEEIMADMAQDVPMNRLLQGDVGSGKTVVAVYAMLVAVANEQQAVLMAPTEVLANQHYRTLTKMLASFPRPYCQVDRHVGRRRAPRNQGAAGGGRDRPGHRHAGDHSGRTDRAQVGAGGDRRAAQVRRAPASPLTRHRRIAALPGDDRHADPADRGHDAVSAIWMYRPFAVIRLGGKKCIPMW